MKRIPSSDLVPKAAERGVSQDASRRRGTGGCADWIILRDASFAGSSRHEVTCIRS
jgi:hypothetical protein